MNKFSIHKIILLFLISFSLYSLPGFSFDLQSSAFSIGAESKDFDSIAESKKIDELLNALESEWNSHDLEKIISHYSDDFINGDGLDKDSIKGLTKELWEAYPDIMSRSNERTVRVFGDYATVDSVDLYEGNSQKVRDEVGSKGVLKAVSMGQLFLKRFGPVWKITSDKTFLEKVSIGYGQGAELIDKNKIKLTAPEQVAGGQQYTATLDFDLPKDVKPVAAISKEVLIYPQVSSEDKFRLTSETKLERWVTSNKIGKNELITATIGLTGEALKPQLVGLVFLTKRVNVIPVSDYTGEVSIINTPAKSALNKTVELLDTFQNNDDKSKKKDKKNTDKENKLEESDF